MALIPQWRPVIGGAFAEPLAQLDSVVAQNRQVMDNNYLRGLHNFERDIGWDRENQRFGIQMDMARRERESDRAARLRAEAIQQAQWQDQLRQNDRQYQFNVANTRAQQDMWGRQLDDAAEARKEQFAFNKAQTAERDLEADRVNKLNALGKLLDAKDEQWSQAVAGLPEADILPYKIQRDNLKARLFNAYDQQKALADEAAKKIQELMTADTSTPIQDRFKKAADKVAKSFGSAKFWQDQAYATTNPDGTVTVRLRSQDPREWFGVSAPPPPPPPPPAPGTGVAAGGETAVSPAAPAEPMPRRVAPPAWGFLNSGEYEGGTFLPYTSPNYAPTPTPSGAPAFTAAPAPPLDNSIAPYTFNAPSRLPVAQPGGVYFNPIPTAASAPPVPEISTEEQFAMLQPGQPFVLVGPDGSRRRGVKN